MCDGPIQIGIATLRWAGLRIRVCVCTGYSAQTNPKNNLYLQPNQWRSAIFSFFFPSLCQFFCASHCQPKRTPNAMSVWGLESFILLCISLWLLVNGKPNGGPVRSDSVIYRESHSLTLAPSSLLLATAGPGADIVCDKIVVNRNDIWTSKWIPNHEPKPKGMHKFPKAISRIPLNAIQSPRKLIK